MDYNTFGRAFKVLVKHDLEEMKVAELNMSAILSEITVEKRKLSNEIRMTTAYYHINVVDVNSEIERLDKEIPALAEKVKQLKESAVFPTTQAKVVYKLRSLKSERDMNERIKLDFNNRVERLNNDLVDLYVEEVQVRRRAVDIKNAMLLYKRAEEKKVFFDRNTTPNAKETYVFFQKLGIIDKPKGDE